MRGVAVLIALITVAVTAACGGASTASLPTVSCDQIIGQAKSGRSDGYRVVLGIVSVPPARLQQAVATQSTPWARWMKSGLVIRASHTPVSVPEAWRKRAAIGWGRSGSVDALTIAACPNPPNPPNAWNAYAGGFYIHTRHVCVPVTFTVGERSQTVRFGIGRTCPTG